MPDVGSSGGATSSDEGNAWDREQLLAGERALADLLVVKSLRTLLSLQVNEDYLVLLNFIKLS